MPKWITYTIRTMLIIILILFAIACMWGYELARDPVPVTVDWAFEGVELYTNWTPEEQQKIIDRRNYLKKCEAYLNELDEKWGSE